MDVSEPLGGQSSALESSACEVVLTKKGMLEAGKIIRRWYPFFIAAQKYYHEHTLTVSQFLWVRSPDTA